MNQHVAMTPSQLRWRCRRGMLELDLLLSNFVEIEYNQLSRDETALFSRLLDYSDQTLLDLLLDKTTSDDVMISNLVGKIRRALHGESR